MSRFLQSLPYTILFDDVIHILVAASREADKHRAAAHLLCELHSVRDGVRALDCGYNSLKARELEEGVDGLLVTDSIVPYPARIAKEGVLGARGRIIETARNRLHGCGLARLVLKHYAVEAVHNALGAVF